MWGTVGHLMGARLLSGTYECSLDSRFRLAVPARLRDAFAGGAVLGRWLDEGGLILAPSPEWPALIRENFGDLTVLDEGQRILRRWVLGGCYEQDLDRQGRVLVPQELREHAGLTERAKVVGVGDYLEVWSPEQLDRGLAELQKEGVSEHAKRVAASRSA